MDEESAPWIWNFFRESLLTLEIRLASLSQAASFQIELVCKEQPADNREWVLLEEPSVTASGSVIDSVKSVGHAEVLFKKFA